LLGTTAIGLIGAALLVVGGGALINSLSRGNVHPSAGLLVGLAIWTVLMSAGTALAMFLNAAHVVRPQVICSSLMAVLNIALSIILARKIGVAGLVWGSVISYTVCIVVPYALLMPPLLRQIVGTTDQVAGAAGVQSQTGQARDTKTTADSLWQA
jgi:Na+-driven multidrug efflux pump